jgi:DNA-binding transcriptional regulator YdaS (Cro superfamily)
MPEWVSQWLCDAVTVAPTGIPVIDDAHVEALTSGQE